MICVFLVYDSTESGLMEKPGIGNQTCDPWFTRHSFCNTACNRRGWIISLFSDYI